MKKYSLFILLAIILLPEVVDAQRWKRYRRQLVVGAGVTNFLGDLGGANQIGRDFVYDLDLAATRPSILVGYRYQVNSFFFLRGDVQWGILHGNDELTEETFRSARNLSFRSHFFEGNAIAEIYVLQNARGNMYNLRGVRGKRGLQIDLYIFGGLGFMRFNPKAEYQGEYVALQPLGTEGQGLPGQKDKYRRTTFTIPYGIGIGKSIDRFWSVGIELTQRFTFTDYIDDVSGEYFGRNNIYNANKANGVSEAEAIKIAFLSDPSTTLGGNTGREPIVNGDRNDLAGQQRGDPTDNDAFMTGMITVSRKIVKRRRSRPKF